MNLTQHLRARGMIFYCVLIAVPAVAVDLDLAAVEREGPASNLDLSISGMSISGTRLYSDGRILDIGNPASPQLIRAYDTSGWPYGLPVATNFTYTPDPTETWLVTDTSDPAHPLWLGGYRTIAAASGPFRVRVSGTLAYVARAGFETIDISDPTRPQRVGGNSAVWEGEQFAVAEGRVLVAAGEQGLVIIDPYRPFRLDPLPSLQPGTFHLRLDGPRGVGVHIERSTDLAQWEDWQAVTLSPTPIEITDTNSASMPNRFYRAVWR